MCIDISPSPVNGLNFHPVESVELLTVPTKMLASSLSASSLLLFLRLPLSILVSQDLSLVEELNNCATQPA